MLDPKFIFQVSEEVFLDLGGDALANIEICVLSKTWSCKESIGSATLLEPKGFLGSGVLPTKSKPAHCELLGFSKGGSGGPKTKRRGPKL